MAIDQSALAQQVAALMDEVENDPEIPAEGSIQRCVLIVEVVGKGQDGEQSFNLRVNSSASPHVSVGFLEVAKAIQFRSLGL